MLIIKQLKIYFKDNILSLFRKNKKAMIREK